MSTAGDSALFLPYMDAMIAAYRAGQASDHVHLGYWPQPPPGPISPDDWRAAQDRLTEAALDLADLHDGQRIADVACGLGGTLRAVLDRVAPAHLAGINLDPRQLALCPGKAEKVTLLQADAVDLPVTPKSFDRLICLEAAFHFCSRAAFLQSAARALAPSGKLVLGDILLARGPLTETETGRAEDRLRRDLGPWPDPWCDVPTIESMTSDAGLTIRTIADVTDGTRPSHAFIAPRPAKDLLQADLDGTQVLRFLHDHGLLRYVLIVLEPKTAQ